MLNYVSMPVGHGNSNEPWMFIAENQCWDKATLNQLLDEYKIVFMTSGDGVLPVMIDERGFIILGSEDDGCIQFPRCHGSFMFHFHPNWIEPFIADLKEAHKLSITE